MRDRAWRVVLVVGVGLSFGYFLLPRGFVLNGLYDAMNVASAGAVVVGVRLHRPERRAPGICSPPGSSSPPSATSPTTTTRWSGT